MCEYKKFRLDKLFVSQNGDYDIQKKHINGKGYWVVSSGETNLGIIGKSDVNAKVFSSGTITIDMFGYANYRGHEYKMVTHARVFSLSLISGEKLSREVGLYFITQFLYFKEIFSYSDMASWSKIKNIEIYLPVTASGEIDYKYMESYIRELEAARIRELEAYLQVTGLTDYRLSNNDTQFISDYYAGGAKYKQFRVGDLFGKLDLKFKKNKFNKSTDISKERTVEFNLPLVNAKHGDNGIMYFGRESDFDSAEMTIDIVGDGAVSTADCYPQPQKTGVLYNAYLIKPAWKAVTRQQLIYLTAVIQRTIKHQFGYDNKAGWGKVKEIYIPLPVTADDNPDYDYMTRFILIQQKIAIKNVVEWKEKELAVYKKVVSN